MSSGNGTSAKPLFEYGEVVVEPIVGTVRIGGRDYKVKAPQYRDWAQIGKFARDAKNEDLEKQFDSMQSYFAVVIPDLSKDVIGALPVKVAGELMERIVKAVEQYVEAQEVSTLESPFSGSPPASPGSPGTPSAM